TPRWLRICTTAAEKPHCGKTGEPFMNSTTGLSVTSCRIRSLTVLSIVDPRFGGSVVKLGSILRSTGLQREGVELISHASAQRLIDHLMLLHPGFATERAGDDMRCIVIAVAAQIFNRNLRIGEAFLDQPLDHRRVHRHRLPPCAQPWAM